MVSGESDVKGNRTRHRWDALENVRGVDDNLQWAYHPAFFVLLAVVWALVRRCGGISCLVHGEDVEGCCVARLGGHIGLREFGVKPGGCKCLGNWVS